MNTRDQYKLAYRYARDILGLVGMGNTIGYRACCMRSNIPTIIVERALDSYRKRNSDRTYNDSLLDRLYDRLVDRYAEEIRDSFNWESITSEAQDSIESDLADYGEPSSTVYLGSILALYPSGKYLHCLAYGNWDDLEAYKDRAYSDALDRVAEQHGGYITSGDSDPCDLFFGISWD